MSLLNFERTHEGWDAFSKINDDGSSFEWRIRVTDAGEFSVNESDSELCSKTVPHFATYENAREWCDEQEAASLRNSTELKTAPQVKIERSAECRAELVRLGFHPIGMSTTDYRQKLQSVLEHPEGEWAITVNIQHQIVS